VVRLGLAGDTMLGRGVADQLDRDRDWELFSPGLVAAAREADAVLLNLECAVSVRGERWPDPRKPFFFRAPPRAVDALVELGVRCVTLANNHALDYGAVALLDTLEHLGSAGITAVGAGPDLAAARRPAVVDVGGLRIGVVGVTDHPLDFAAGDDRPGVAYANLHRDGVPAWLSGSVRDLTTEVDLVVVMPHWGPNMNRAPLPYVRRAAVDLREAGAGVVAGHSAHVFQGVGGSVLFDLGDFIDDYAVDPVLRNDIGLFFLLEVDRDGPVRLDALPLTLDFCRTRLADAADAAWARQRFRSACIELGTEVGIEAGRLVVTWPRG
jgi:poly-gamma-glutamate capsule biosynthesis protein CapA/YwtB (metallophosphatase superfamily)